MKRIVLIILMILISALFTRGIEANGQTVTELEAIKVAKSPVIDGHLDDAIWKNRASVDDIFITYNPVDGKVLPQKTRVWVAYDEDNLYFAFYCHDTDPKGIKTSVTKRDNLWNDDWVGFALDSMGSKQCLYEFFINPSGAQADLYKTAQSGENSAPDWVWHSGSKIVEDGYTVEVQLPLKSIRFRSGENVKMNIMFWRRISRLGLSGSWPEISPGLGTLNSVTEVSYKKLNSQRLLEFIPSITYSSIWDRKSPDTWSDPEDRTDLGISGKYGVTSTITAEMTWNPDFSQVESDTFQVLKNNRYPIFYDEKRPFFMEAGDQFSLAGSTKNLWTPVHTRKIVNPLWGARLTGDVGNLSFALLASGDEWAGRELDDEDNYYLGNNALYTIGRAKYKLGGDSFVGMLYSGKELADYHNRVVAVDGLFRFGDNHTVTANYYYTDTNDPEEVEKYSGNAVSARYKYSSQTFYATGDFNYFDDGFRMDTAYYQRTDIVSGQLFLMPMINLNSENQSGFIHRIRPFLDLRYVHDYDTDMDDSYAALALELDMTKQGYFSLYWFFHNDESWKGVVYDCNEIGGAVGIQILPWLNYHTCFNYGNMIYYDDDDPFLGKRFRIHIATDIEPLDTFSVYFSYEFTDFNVQETGEDYYDYHIFYSRVTYQPDNHLFFRALIQYDSYLDIVLSDMLISYELVPGTVLHLGYGSLHEKLFWDGEKREWLDEHTLREYYQTRNSLFLKASYRLQL